VLSFKSSFGMGNKPALEPSKRPALVFCARAHHRRCAREGLTGRYDASPGKKLQADDLFSGAHREDDAEPDPAAVHLFVTFGHPLQRKLFDHRMHVRQCAEFQRILRILCRTGIPTRD
jgi:hypothetical protein